MGAEAIQSLLKEVNLDDEIADIREEIPNTKSETKIKKFSKRLKLLEAFHGSGNKPEWMVLRCFQCFRQISSIGATDGGRFATSDLNDLIVE